MFCFQFNLETWLIGVMFLIAPGFYGLTAPLMGYLGDKGVGNDFMSPNFCVYPRKQKHAFDRSS